MTIRVYRVRRDGTRTRDLSRTTVRATVPGRGPLPLSQGYPTCHCPRCRTRATPSV